MAKGVYSLCDQPYRIKLIIKIVYPKLYENFWSFCTSFQKENQLEILRKLESERKKEQERLRNKKKQKETEIKWETERDTDR